MSVEMVKATLNGKYEIILPKHRADRPEWYTEAGWERKRLDSMHDNIGEGDVVYYIGAEEGEMAALCAMWGADVVLFEPNDRVLPNIKAIWESNKLVPPLFYAGFASDVDSENYKTGLTTINLIEGEVIGDHGFRELRDAGSIPQIRIDTLLHDSRIPTAICLDVEGSEGRVLRGAEGTLRLHHPKIWLSLHPEFLHEQYGEWGAELRKWIIDLGYKETLLDYPLHEVHLLYDPL